MFGHIDQESDAYSYELEIQTCYIKIKEEATRKFEERLGGLSGE